MVGEMMKNNKEFKKLDEQIEILRNKGLTINDSNYAADVLFRENYFFLNGYRHLFMKSSTNRTYIPGTTFEELYSLFLFDRSFRNILFKNILNIENNLKSIISYHLSLRYGYHEKDYLNRKNFTNNQEKNKQVNDVIRKMKRQIKSNAESHSATMHYVNSYGYIPMWVLVKVLSFGIIGELYSILKKEDQINIADVYNLDSETLNNYLTLLSNYRNLCAHEDILFENKTQRNIADTKYHRMLKIPITNEEYIYGKNDVFALIIVMKQMLKNTEFKNMCLEIDHAFKNLELNIKSIPMSKIYDRMGFPNNWKDIIDIKREEKRVYYEKQD
jgi:abortive infection bacteriophage resistance protein